MERLLQDGRAAGGKELGEYLEVAGYSRAARWLYAQAVEQPSTRSKGDPISLIELRQLHKLVVEPVWLHSPPANMHLAERLGAFRLHDIRPLQSGTMPPPFREVAARVTDWLATVNGGPAYQYHATPAVRTPRAGPH